MAFHLYSRGKASGVYLPLAPIFPTNLPPDIRWGFDAIWNISIITTDSGVFEYSLDGGVTFFPLITTVANTEVICNIKADDKDSFNLRTTGGATVFRILVSIAPEDIQRRTVTGGVANQVEIVAPLPLPVDICPVNCDVPVINGSVSPLQVSVANPQGTPVGLIILSLTNSAITSNTDLAVADLPPVGTSPGDAVIYRILWSASGTGKLSFTLDSTNFVDFNNSALILREAGSLFDVVVEDGDAFNLQFDRNATIRFLRVVQLI